MFLPTLKRENLTLAGPTSSFQRWLKGKYYKNVFQGIGKAPLEKFMDDLENISERIPKETLELVFYRRLCWKVRPDGTISVGGKLYEVPVKYIG